MIGPALFFLPIRKEMLHRSPEDVRKEKTMGSKRKPSKRPCRICGRWFVPNPRLGERQKTCGTAECQRRWHARKCAEWNRKNRVYFTEIYLTRRLESINDSCGSPGKCCAPHLPHGVVQEVIGVKPLIIIGDMTRLLLRGVQVVIRLQRSDRRSESRRLPLQSIARGYSYAPP